MQKTTLNFVSYLIVCWACVMQSTTNTIRSKFWFEKESFLFSATLQQLQPQHKQISKYEWSNVKHNWVAYICMYRFGCCALLVLCCYVDVVVVSICVVIGLCCVTMCCVVVFV